MESIYTKNIVAILHLLVALVRHFRAPVRLPENVFVTVIIAQKQGASLNAQYEYFILFYFDNFINISFIENSKNKLLQSTMMLECVVRKMLLIHCLIVPQKN